MLSVLLGFELSETPDSGPILCLHCLPCSVLPCPAGKQPFSLGGSQSSVFMTGDAGALGSWEVMPAPLPSRGSWGL